jgi:hypothetical protein
MVNWRSDFGVLRDAGCAGLSRFIYQCRRHCLYRFDISSSGDHISSVDAFVGLDYSETQDTCTNRTPSSGCQNTNT